MEDGIDNCDLSLVSVDWKLASKLIDGTPLHLFSELCEEIVEIENNFNLKCTLCKPLCAILSKSTNKKKYFLNDASSHGIQENGVHL